MSEEFFKKFKKYGIWIAAFILIEFLSHYFKLEKYYWKVDIAKSEKNLEQYNFYFFIIYFVFASLYLWRRYNKISQEKNQDILIYEIVFVAIFGIAIYFNFNQTLNEGKLFINRLFNQESITKNYDIYRKGDDFLFISVYKEGDESLDIDSTKYKNTLLKDSVAVIKSKIGLFKIPYDNQIVEIK